MRRHLLAGSTALLLAAAVATAPAASAAPPIDSSALRDAVTVEGIRAHQAALQAIADANGGTRASGTPGYDASADYVRGLLEGAGYDVTVQPFTFPFFEELAEPQLSQVSPDPTTYTAVTDFNSMEYSGSGTVEAAITAVEVDLTPAGGSTSGCEDSDFAGFPAGTVALIQRGTCTFGEKAVNAQEAGAAAAIIFNEGNTPDRQGPINGTLGAPVGIPVLDASFAVGADLAEPAGTVVRIVTQTTSENRDTVNVIADTPGGREDRTVVVGAHLDSVPEGPGINDNGSGTAAILETALQMDALGVAPRNNVRFAFWGAEESGLLGSEFYVAQLTARQIKDIAVNLNFDMLGSSNFVRFVYDGDGSASDPAGPNGSGNVEKVFLDYFASQELATEPTAFDGRSDYGPFIAVGIPAGGLFSGAEGIKTAEEAAVYGGIVGEQYDPCYHEACDTFDNNSNTALDQLGDAAVHSVLTFAQTTSAVSGTARASSVSLDAQEFKGAHRQR